MPPQDHAAIVRRFFEEVFNRGNFDYIDEIIAPDYTFNGARSSAERTKQWAKRKKSTYRTLEFQIENLVSAGDTVSFDWSMRGIAAEGSTEPVTRRGHTRLAFSAGRCVSNTQTDRDSNPPQARSI